MMTPVVRQIISQLPCDRLIFPAWRFYDGLKQVASLEADLLINFQLSKYGSPLPSLGCTWLEAVREAQDNFPPWGGAHRTSPMLGRAKPVA